MSPPIAVPMPIIDARMKSVRNVAATRSHRRPYEPQAGTTMNARYAPAATTPVRISDTVTGLTLFAISNMRGLIVANAVDDDRDGKDACERSESESPAAGDV